MAITTKGGTQPKPVDLMTTEGVKIEGEHVEAGTLLSAVDFELAMDIVGAGRARLANDDDRAAAAKAAKAAKAAA